MHRQQNAIGLDSLLMITYKKGKQRGFPVTGMIYKTKSAAMYDFKEMVEDEGITLSEMNRIYEICYLDVLNDVLGD